MEFLTPVISYMMPDIQAWPDPARYFRRGAIDAICLSPSLQCKWADQLGFEAVCVNDHHQKASGTMPSANVAAARLARRTQQAKLVILSNPTHARDRFHVGYDLIVKAWTTEVPFA